MLYATGFRSPVGELTLASDGENLVGLWIAGQKYFGGNFFKRFAEHGDLQVFRAAKEWLERYFAGERPAPSELPLAPSGSEFARTVWQILLEIPYGGTMTYGEIAALSAARLGRTAMSAQAVGGAVGHNPISIVIPCHRVVGTKGNLTGYASGLDKKLWLLNHERVDVSKLTAPTRGTAL